jgi:hypothetical protein
MSSNVEVRRSGLRVRLDSRINTQRKKLIVITASTIVATTSLLAVAGFWNPDSPRYWRRPAQATAFFGARHAPRSLVAPMTRLALRTHVAGTSYAEIEEAASLFENVGENKAASILWLSLVRMDVTSNKLDEAIRHATLSQTARPSEEALTALVSLNIKNSKSRGRWISELQTNYPENELSQVTLCLTQIESFDNAIPDPCQKVNWILEKATVSKNEYEKLSKQILNLPNEARLNIKKYEQEIADRNFKQGGYRSDLEEIDRQKSETVVNGVIGVIIELLPLPKAGDTLETYLSREGICLLPYVRWVCRAADLGPAFEAKKQYQQLDERRELILELIRLNDELSNYARQKIEYWRSSKPLEELKKAKSNILPTFQGDVEETISANKGNAGLSLDEAISMATQ